LFVLRSVLKYFMDTGIKLHDLYEAELIELIHPYGECLGKYFAGLSPQELDRFRKLRGGQGHGTGTRLCQAVLSKRFPEFKPAGLQEFMELEALNTTEEAMKSAQRIEIMLHRFVLNELKEEYGRDETGWWFKGVPKETRQRIDKARNEEETPPAREHLLYLIDFRKIIEENWPLFGEILVQGSAQAKKDAKTKWLVKVNEIRNLAAHPAKGPVALEDVDFLKKTESWLRTRLEEVDAGETELSEPEPALSEV
jgi:DNA sulfur modification protein DndB